MTPTPDTPPFETERRDRELPRPTPTPTPAYGGGVLFGKVTTTGTPGANKFVKVQIQDVPVGAAENVAATPVAGETILALNLNAATAFNDYVKLCRVPHRWVTCKKITATPTPTPTPTPTCTNQHIGVGQATGCAGVFSPVPYHMHIDDPVGATFFDGTITTTVNLTPTLTGTYPWTASGWPGGFVPSGASSGTVSVACVTGTPAVQVVPFGLLKDPAWACMLCTTCSPDYQPVHVAGDLTVSWSGGSATLSPYPGDASGNPSLRILGLTCFGGTPGANDYTNVWMGTQTFAATCCTVADGACTDPGGTCAPGDVTLVWVFSPNDGTGCRLDLWVMSSTFGPSGCNSSTPIYPNRGAVSFTGTYPATSNYSVTSLGGGNSCFQSLARVASFTRTFGDPTPTCDPVFFQTANQDVTAGGGLPGRLFGSALGGGSCGSAPAITVTVTS